MFKSFFSRWNPCSKRSTANQESSSISQPQSTYLLPSEEASFSYSIPEIPSTETSFTFKVDEVELPKGYPSLVTAEEILREKVYDQEDEKRPHEPTRLTRDFEDCSHREDMDAKYVDCHIPGMITAIHMAYHGHYALSLSVSDFIILIGQGLGAHINENAEKLRRHFVDFEDKQTIIIERNDFVLGQHNDWSTVIGEFAEQIKKKVKADVYDIIVDDTSVATATTRIVSEITLMEAMKSYFNYYAMTMCGIPQITLEGKREDWQKLKEKVDKLVNMNKDDCLELKWWLDQLVPVVDQICEAGIERKVDKEFWSSIYKYRDQSGGPIVGGWIIKFFPYLVRGRSGFGGITTMDIPKQICKVPFIWNYYGDEIQMKFTAGFLGAEFNKGLCQVKPTQFWCVTQTGKRMK